MSSLSVLSLPAPPSHSTQHPEVWISYGDAVRICRRSAEWMRQQVLAGAVLVRTTDRVQRNGRPDREVLLSTLPDAAQRRYASEAAMMPCQPSLALVLTGPQLVSAPRIAVPAAKASEAERKHTILQPILDMQHEHHRAAAAASLKLADGRAVDSQNRMMEYQVERARERGEDLSVRTLKRWIAGWKEQGEGALVRQRRSDAGHSRFFREHEDAAALVAYMHLGDKLTPGLSMQACHDMLVAQRELVGLTAAEVPDYKTVRTFLHSMSPAVRTLALEGSKVFGEQMLPYLSRAYNEPSNFAWLSDHMICDVEVLNDCMPGAPLGNPVRLRLTAIIDYRSRYVVGWTFCVEGSSASIANAFRRAVAAHGPCSLWYCDNGKDYIKVAKGATPGYMRPGSVEAEEWAEDEMRRIERTGILARLGVRVTHCLAHHPQSKHIERFFRTVHLTFCKLWPTYTGGKPSERPEQTEALMMHHRRAMRRGDLTQSHHPLASELIAKFEQWLEVYHNKRGHRGKGMGFGSPAEVFAQYRSAEQRPAPTPEELAYLMWERTTAVVRECQLRVNKQDYAASGPDAMLQSRILMSLNGRGKVPVAFDPLEPSHIAVLDDDGRLLTILAAKRLVRMAPDDPETQQQIAEMQRTRALLTRDMRDTHTAVVVAAKRMGVLKPLQLLPSVAPAAPAVDVEAAKADRRITPRKPKPSEPGAAAFRLPLSPRQAAARLIAQQQKEQQ